MPRVVDRLGLPVRTERLLGASVRRSSRRPAGDGPSPTELRDWAKANGHTVSERGRISAEVRAAYAAAH
ncbi:Lsr2 family DNA-binding protein [Cellulomonas persica]|uniref:Lsr2 family DNA-binding protein n=1 Tax=Cellulomonas persica TaxID=76861 RepID=UPI0027D97ABF|nr:histone-like nucleoid-structuring protein Lsr2 [Cellulomonas persica]